MELKTEKNHIAAAIGLLILIGFAATNAVGQVTTQETGPSAINITTDPITNAKETEATFQATLTGFDNTDYDSALIFWNYSTGSTLDKRGPATFLNNEKQTSMYQPELSPDTSYNVESYAEPLVWEDDTLENNAAIKLGNRPQSFRDSSFHDKVGSGKYAKLVSMDSSANTAFYYSPQFDGYSDTLWSNQQGSSYYFKGMNESKSGGQAWFRDVSSNPLGGVARKIEIDSQTENKKEFAEISFNANLTKFNQMKFYYKFEGSTRYAVQYGIYLNGTQKWSTTYESSWTSKELDLSSETGVREVQARVHNRDTEDVEGGIDNSRFYITGISFN